MPSASADLCCRTPLLRLELVRHMKIQSVLKDFSHSWIPMCSHGSNLLLLSLMTSFLLWLPLGLTDDKLQPQHKNQRQQTTLHRLLHQLPHHIASEVALTELLWWQKCLMHKLPDRIVTSTYSLKCTQNNWEIKIYSYLILIDLNLSSHVWMVASILGNAGLTSK
jgi:hypothetical protein